MGHGGRTWWGELRKPKWVVFTWLESTPVMAVVPPSAVKVSAGFSRVTMQTTPPGLSDFIIVFDTANHTGNFQIRLEESRFD